MSALISLERVTKRFTQGGSPLLSRLKLTPAPQTALAVDDVSLDLQPGEIVAVVGESGCGKSTLGRLAAGLMQPSEGVVRFEGADLRALSGSRAKRARLAVQMVFQDPLASLSPRMRVRDLVGEAPVAHRMTERAALDSYVDRVLRQVALNPADKLKFPHQFSGGQRQRIAIARALAVKPQLLICDEALAALDVSIQAQIVNLLASLRRELGLAFLFISHDLRMVEYFSDRVAVMYLGRIVEIGPTARVFTAPRHPYTRALLAQAPKLNRQRAPGKIVQGEVPSPFDPPLGCGFHPRCDVAEARCANTRPELKVDASGVSAACLVAQHS